LTLIANYSEREPFEKRLISISRIHELTFEKFDHHHTVTWKSATVKLKVAVSALMYVHYTTFVCLFVVEL